MAPPPRPRERRPPPKGGVAPTRPSPLLPGAEPSGAHVTCPPPASPPCCFSLPSAPGGGAAGPRRWRRFLFAGRLAAVWRARRDSVYLRGRRDGAGVRVRGLAVRRDPRSCHGSLGVQGVSPLPFHPSAYGRALVSPWRGGAAGCARRRWVRARLGAGRVA